MKYENLKIGDQISLKKSHPSKTIWWTLIRKGAKFKFQSSIKNDLFIELSREVMNKQIKEIKEI
ncbi:DUF951 family protein [Mesoplasma photuris]|uniref:DUF951 family protein n=1 Tax=Mesoplasma photuris TaxID=217731 RepID=UPI0004E0D2AA|nr:DUF951 family protein [Mesoplasma photuris]